MSLIVVSKPGNVFSGSEKPFEHGNVTEKQYGLTEQLLYSFKYELNITLRYSMGQ